MRLLHLDGGGAFPTIPAEEKEHDDLPFLAHVKSTAEVVLLRLRLILYEHSVPSFSSTTELVIFAETVDDGRPPRGGIRLDVPSYGSDDDGYAYELRGTHQRNIVTRRGARGIPMLSTCQWDGTVAQNSVLVILAIVVCSRYG